MDNYLIYPKQFQRVNIPIEKNRCFVIMPFKKELNLVYGYIKKELNEAGFICNRVDELTGSTPIINKILTEILRSRYIIADLTDCNPNVFYELGVAQSFKDASNIIILKQRGSTVPFDVTHLTYIEYDPHNSKFITAEILQNISQYSYLSDFQEALNLRGIISYIKDNGDYFIDYLRTELDDSLSFLSRILVNELNGIDEQTLEHLLDRYEIALSKCIKDNQANILPGMLKVYQECLVSSSHMTSTQDHVCRFLDGTFLSRFSCKEPDKLSWETDLAIALASNQKMLSTVLPWIISYFSHSKTATIDLNRYKLEAFLMTCSHPVVNEAICAAVFDRDCYIREHMADIIGEKRLYSAIDNLCSQLRSEQNYFSAVSIIEALGKLADSHALPYIYNWISTNEAKIISENQLFVLKHAKVAIAKLDNKSGENIKLFDEKYGKILNDYYIF